MAGPTILAAQPNLVASGADQGGYRSALLSLTTLFFMWGFITSLNDILIPHLKNVFSLNYTQAMLVQFCFFSAYFLVSLPAGAITRRIGYQKGMVIGLVIAGIGCLMFYPAASIRSYPLFLGALFVLASGITLLQVSANPYVSALGDPKTASSRLTMTQAFNALGTTVAPFFGALLILGVATEAADSASLIDKQAEAVQFPYLLLAASLFILAAVFAWLKLPKVDFANTDAADNEAQAGSGSAWQYRHLVLGALGIFVYVGAEVSIGSFLVNFLGEESIAGMEELEAAKYIAYYWGGAMVGRFIGAAAMQKIAGGKALFFCAVMAVLLIAITMLTSGAVAMWAILMVGLFNSIMFPTIFSLAITGLGQHTSQASGILCLAIVGGAVIPLLQGVLADLMGIQQAFFLPIICYLFIAYYGISGSKPVYHNGIKGE
ncbi:MAG: FHS family L-fucose permease-like MFS transporter [Phenylobacterium sp.]|jgi:FHS family L-fucose permease-like MFS transporter